MGAITGILAGVLSGILSSIGWQKLITSVVINLLTSLVASSKNKLTSDLADPVIQALKDTQAK